MKHTTSRLLFSYWDAMRRERAAPERSDIQPGQIRHILADTFILAAEPGGEATFRLAGTRCSALFGRDLKGVSFASLWPAHRREEADRLVETVTSDTAGLVAGLTGRTDSETFIGLELLLLPLRHRGRTHTRILGALSPASLPTWVGLFPLTSVETGSLRVVRANTAVPADAEAPVEDAAERRRRFVVLEGGRTSSPHAAFRAGV